jgi:hypothetical protein|tara:strand:- start:250 stop:894 length:645 start_codon:yes stop_codon:yes gene_type:complete
MSNLPFVKSNTGDSSSFLGYKQCKIYEFVDESNESFASWSNIFLTIILNVKGSSYERKMSVKGTWEHDDNGNVVDCALLRKIHRLLDAIGCNDIGINVKGNWQNLQGDIIEDIGTYLSDKYASNPVDESFPYVAYIYKKTPRPGKTKVYTEVYPYLIKDEEEQVNTLKEHIEWCRKNGNLKEYNPNTVEEPETEEEENVDPPFDTSDLNLPDSL